MNKKYNISIIIIIFFTLISNETLAQKREILYQEEKVSLIFDHYDTIPHRGMPFTNILYINKNGKNDTICMPHLFPIKGIYKNNKVAVIYRLSNISNFCINEKIDEVWKPIFWHTSAIPRKMEGSLKYEAEIVSINNFKEIMTDQNGQTLINSYEIDMKKEEYIMYRISTDHKKTVFKKFPFPILSNV